MNYGTIEQTPHDAHLTMRDDNVVAMEFNRGLIKSIENILNLLVDTKNFKKATDLDDIKLELTTLYFKHVQLG